MKKQARILIALSMAGCWMASMTDAQADNTAWRLSGFGTFGALGTDTDKIGFVRDQMQADSARDSWGISTDSRLGLQLDGKLSDTLNFGAQWVARNQVGDYIERNLDWAYLRWQPSDDFTLRVGRLGGDIYLLADHRNVSYAYPWMRPPHEFYSYLPSQHYDGVDIAKEFDINGRAVTVKLLGGHVDSSIYRLGTIGAFEGMLAGLTVGFKHSNNWNSKLTYARFNMIQGSEDKSIPVKFGGLWLDRLFPGIDAMLSRFIPKNTEVDYFSIGSAYDDSTWLASAEAAYTKSNAAFGPSRASAYLSIGRRFSSLTFYTLLGFSKTLRDPIKIPDPVANTPQTQALYQKLDFYFNASASDQKSASLGLRWDAFEDIAFKAQWSHYWLNPKGIGLWDIKPGEKDIPNNVNVFSLGVDFIF